MAEVSLRRAFPVTGALILLAICGLLTVALLVDAAVRSGIQDALLLAPWPLLALWAVYVVGVASDIRAGAAGMRVQNLLRRTWAPWSEVKRIAMRWQLEITLDDGAVVRCFGGPARSRARRIGPERTREDSAGESEDGIAMLQRLRAEAQERGTSGQDAALTRTWDVPALAALVVLVIWAVAAVLLTR